MQRITTIIFIVSSILFGIIGITVVLIPDPYGDNSTLFTVMQKLLAVCVFIVLPSLALTVASKYFSAKK